MFYTICIILNIYTVCAISHSQFFQSFHRCFASSCLRTVLFFYYFW